MGVVAGVVGVAGDRGWSLHLHCEQLMCEYVRNDRSWQRLFTDEPLDGRADHWVACWNSLRLRKHRNFLIQLLC